MDFMFDDTKRIDVPDSVPSNYWIRDRTLSAVASHYEQFPARQVSIGMGNGGTRTFAGADIVDLMRTDDEMGRRIGYAHHLLEVQARKNRRTAFVAAAGIVALVTAGLIYAISGTTVSAGERPNTKDRAIYSTQGNLETSLR